MNDTAPQRLPQPDQAAATSVTRRSARAGRGATVAHNPTPKAGRNLYAAIGVGLGLAALVLVSLFVRKEAFVVLATAAAVVGTRELLRAMAHGNIHPPAVPTLAGAAIIPPVAYAFGPQALAAAVALTFVGILVWRSIGRVRDSAADVAGGIFTTLYVPTLISFAILLVHPADGPQRIVVFILTTVCSDIGGYAVGVVFGKHPMAPTVSPKKSWEGFAGSFASCVLAGSLAVHFLLDGRWWIGALMGCCLVVAATIGDLCESMIKRDLGIKDMSNLIPGHGGLMDRLDSLVIAAPVTWAILTPFVAVN